MIQLNEQQAVWIQKVLRDSVWCSRHITSARRLKRIISQKEYTNNDRDVLKDWIIPEYTSWLSEAKTLTKL